MTTSIPLTSAALCEAAAIKDRIEKLGACLSKGRAKPAGRMQRFLYGLVVLLLPFVHSGSAQDAKAQLLAEAVIRASGGETWLRVKEIEFTFNVEQDGKQLLSAKHHWDVVAGKDTVTWDGKAVTVDVNAKPSEKSEMEAYKRWVNDSYWLLAPLKLQDSGTQLKYIGVREIDGMKYEVIEMSFGKVGLTSGDHYNLYIDPKSHLLRRWDYLPSPDRKITGSWDNYQTFDDLKLSTEHQFDGKRIYFTDIKVRH